MATLFRVRDERNQEHASKDAERFQTTNDRPPDMSLQEPGAKVWMPYLELADKYDKDLVHNWRDDMDSLLIFAALFSASVTAFVIESYSNLVQDPGEVTISVLLQISQQIANGTQAAAVRPSFQPASIDIAVNILWFLSLAFSLTCALAAVLVRQWARQYLRFPRSFSSMSEQARARQFVFENTQWWKMDVIVEMIPALLHISLILFFVGLLLFVRSVSYTLAAYLLCFCAIGGAAYALLTTTSLVFSGCPYKTPFTGFLGLWVKGGTPLFRAIWIGLTTFVAIVVVILCTALSLLTNRCFPSVNPAIPSWAVKMSAPITLRLQRIITRFRATEMSSGNILLFFNNIRSSFLLCTHSSLAVAVSSVKRTTRGFSMAFKERQQMFRDELTFRDAHALQWAMEYSKRDTDLLDIITSVPEFLELNNSAEARMVMQRSSVIPRAMRLLQSCAFNDEINKAVCVACLKSIIVLASCSTQAIELDNYEPDISLLSHLISKFTYDKATQLDNDIAQLAFCTISNLVLGRVYKLENSLKMTNEDELKLQAVQLTSTTSSFIRRLEGNFACGFRFAGDPLRDFQVDHGFLNSVSGWGISRFCFPTTSVMTYCNSLRQFRSAWVTAWIRFHFYSPSPIHHQCWASLLDSTTHLQESPYSTRESQHCVFMLADKCLQEESSPPRVSGSRLSALRMKSISAAYCMVLYGQEMLFLRLGDRKSLHADFANHIHVNRGNPTGNFGEVVDIPFDIYAIIIGELASCIPKFASGANEYAWHHRGSPVESEEFWDASAVAIRKMIHCRIHDISRREELSIILDAWHLRAVRTLRKYSNTWKGLVERTAAEYGYSTQVDDEYNIDMHEELRFYDSGFSPYGALESPEYSSLLGDWGCGPDPTFRPGVW